LRLPPKRCGKQTAPPRALSYCATSDLGAWQAAILDVLAQAPETSLGLRLRHAATYSWQAHAEIIVEAHRRALALEKR
jgi:hypothetical protein